METQRFFRCAAVIGALCLAGSQLSQAQQVRVYNTVKEKLARGEQVVGGTVISSDPNMYCSRWPTLGSTSSGSRCSTAR